MTLEQWLKELRPLTPNEFESAKSDAEKVILKDLGDAPEKKDYERETDAFYKNPIFILIVVIFVIAAIVSAFEGFHYIGESMNHRFESVSSFVYGTQIDHNLMTTTFQIGFWLLAEFTMLVMMIAWRFEVEEKKRNKFYDKFNLYNKIFNQYFDLRLIVSILSMSYIMLVNWSSSLHPLIRIMPAIITITLGFLLEKFYTEWYLERQSVNREYNKDYNIWQEIKRSPESHPDYDNFLKRSIWNRIRSKNSRYNVDIDVAGAWKYEAVQKEFNNFNWAKYEHNRIKAQTVNKELDETSSEIEQIKAIVDNGWNAKETIETNNYLIEVIDDKILFTDKALSEQKEFDKVSSLRRSITAKVNRINSG